MRVEIATKWILGLALMSTPLMASDDRLQERAVVGSRPLQEAELIQEQKKELIYKLENGMELTEEEEACFSEENNSVAPRAITKKAMTAATYYTTHEGALHQPVAVSLMGDMIELEDGSIWMVASSDRKKTFDWMTGDDIVIIPNDSWFSSYHYLFANLNTGALVRVNLSLAPIYNGLHTHWIIGINYINREVYLEDGSVWQMSWWDHSIIDQWLANDTVIIGLNSGLLSSSNPNILINVNLDEYAIGTCIH